MISQPIPLSGLRSAFCLVLAFFLIMSFFSCEKNTPEPTGTNPALRITYPAAYVASLDTDSIAVLHLDSMLVRDYIPLPKGSKAHRLALSPDESRLLLTLSGTPRTANTYPILVLDATTGLEINAINHAEPANNALWSPDGREVWVTYGISGTVSVYDAVRGFELLTTISVESGMGEAIFSQDGQYCIIPNPAKNKVHIIRKTDKTLLQSVSVSGTPGLVYASSLQTLFIANETAKTLTLVSSDDFSIQKTIMLGFTPGPMAYTKSDFHLWVINKDFNQLARYQRSGSDWLPAGAMSTGVEPESMALTKNNNLMLVSNRQSGTVSFIQVQGQNKLHDVSVGKFPCGIAIRE